MNLGIIYLPYYYIILIVLLIFFVVRIRSRKRKMSKPERVIGLHFHECLTYVTSRYKAVVTQEWVVSNYHKEKYFKQLKKNQKRPTSLRIQKFNKEINKRGINDPQSGQLYAGKIKYSLCSPKANYPYTFSIDQYDRLGEIWGRLKLFNAVNQVEVMTRNAWTKGYLSANLHYGYGGISQKEAKELYELILLKLRFTNEVRKINSYSPYELGFIHAYEHQQSVKNGTQKYLFQPELESLQATEGVFGDPKGHFSIKGVNIGSWYYYEGEGNFITFGGARSGKGVNLIVPQLLNFEAYEDGSIVAVDIKGTLTAISARTLNENGFETIILDPWNVQNSIGATHNIAPHSFNPIDIISRDPDHTYDHCDALARILIPVRTNTSDNHWDDKARQWVSTYLFYLATNDLLTDEERTLSNLRSLFKKNKGERNQLFENMIDGSVSEAFSDDVNEIAYMVENSEKEASGILSNITRELDVFKSPPLQRALDVSSFDINQITNGKMRVFIVIDLENLSTHNKWLQLMLTSIIMTIRRTPKKKVLMIIDEMYSIGHLDIVEKSMSFMPEYKLQLWTIWQDLNQMKKMYPTSWETFISNSAVTTWLGMEGNETPEYLSKLISTKHIKYKKTQSIINDLEGKGSSGTELYEIPMQSALQLRMNDGIVARVKGHPQPYYFKPAPYYEDILLVERADPNPLRDNYEDHSEENE